MANVSQVEWLNQNSLRSYPIRENAQRRPVYSDGSLIEGIRIPNYLVTDFVISVGDSVVDDIYIMKLAKIGSTLTLVIGCDNKSVANIVVDLNEHKTNTPYRFSGVDEFSDSVGCLVVGNTEDLVVDLPDGVYNFNSDETCFEHRCVRPSIRNVSSISITNTDTGYSSKKLRGDVKLIAGANISLKFDEAQNAIWVSASTNAGYNEKCECGEETTVKTINGISVEDVTLVGDDCVSVTTKGKTIRISDKCSKPCCGCAELDFINQKIAQINTSINKLDTYTAVIDTRITELQASYVQSNSGSSST